MSKVPEYIMSTNGTEESKPDCHNAWMNNQCPMCGARLRNMHGELMHHVIFHLTGRSACEPGEVYGWICKSEHLTNCRSGICACMFCSQKLPSDGVRCCGSERNAGYWFASHLANSKQCAALFLLSDHAHMEL